jgi:hypothetical protein
VKTHGTLCIIQLVAEKTGKKRNFFKNKMKTTKRSVEGPLIVRVVIFPEG